MTRFGPELNFWVQKEKDQLGHHINTSQPIVLIFWHSSDYLEMWKK